MEIGPSLPGIFNLEIAMTGGGGGARGGGWWGWGTFHGGGGVRTSLSGCPVGPAVFGQQSLKLLEKGGEIPGGLVGDRDHRYKAGGKVRSELRFP